MSSPIPLQSALLLNGSISPALVNASILSGVLPRGYNVTQYPTMGAIGLFSVAACNTSTCNTTEERPFLDGAWRFHFCIWPAAACKHGMLTLSAVLPAVFTLHHSLRTPPPSSFTSVQRRTQHSRTPSSLTHQPPGISTARPLQAGCSRFRTQRLRTSCFGLEGSRTATAPQQHGEQNSCEESATSQP